MLPDSRIPLKRILVVRPDRIGDVLLSTPALSALRRALPDAFIAVLVAPHAYEIVELNPYVDRVLVIDKKGRHRGIVGMAMLVKELKREQFDMALVLHGTRRLHLALFWARIPTRIGYNRKWGFLLTRRLKDVKPHGEKHETEYSLDLLRQVGLRIQNAPVLLPTTAESDQTIDRFLKDEGVAVGETVVVLHPGASSPSKRWMAQRFAQLADRLIQKRGLRLVVICGPQDVATGRAVLQAMHSRGIDACGKLSLREVGSLLKRSCLLISNDSGPVHAAVGVGTPVISIFGRSQPGLSQNRWRPLGPRDVALQKDVGCVVCLADDCQIDFECLKALSVDEVFEAAEKLLATSDK